MTYRAWRQTPVAVLSWTVPVSRWTVALAVVAWVLPAAD
jgi:hypothetical protein